MKRKIFIALLVLSAMIALFVFAACAPLDGPYSSHSESSSAAVSDSAGGGSSGNDSTGDDSTGNDSTGNNSSGIELPSIPFSFIH